MEIVQYAIGKTNDRGKIAQFVFILTINFLINFTKNKLQM